MGRKACERFRCSCGERCVMVPSESTGTLAPITAETHEDGNVVLILQATDNGTKYTYRVLGKPEDRTANAGLLRLNHYATCPDAGRFRK